MAAGFSAFLLGMEDFLPSELCTSFLKARWGEVTTEEDRMEGESQEKGFQDIVEARGVWEASQSRLGGQGKLGNDHSLCIIGRLFQER